MMETIETILMLPFYVFKYAFSLAFWFFVITYVLSTDWYQDITGRLRNRLDGK